MCVSDDVLVPMAVDTIIFSQVQMRLSTNN